MVVGIDVGAAQLHCVALDGDGTVVDGQVLAASDLAAVAALAAAAEGIAVDAPAGPSDAPHRASAELSPKFRSARCAEIDLGVRFRLWVPWTTPTGPPFPKWMETGFSVYRALEGADVIEVYPHAGFRRLAGKAPLPKKTTAAGVRARVALLRDVGVRAKWLELWSHDSLDAALAALVALRRTRGEAKSAGCGHDGSAIWLPA